MHRTTILLPHSLKNRIDAASRKEGISASEFIRRAVLAALDRSAQEHDEDPFFSDRAVHRGAIPADLSAEHDAYLGDRS
jgi:Arc/MetJ-type ribon-helix-helix transcriptional regulator